MPELVEKDDDAQYEQEREPAVAIPDPDNDISHLKQTPGSDGAQFF
jgi:hypothetical protein